ncbi:MAG: MBOAT family protein [Lachnospiraceae bacterium]|nr:MBOAT family protein [Lachnospiraceae bacterium]
MVFSSITFLVYFLPIVILGYYILGFSRPLQNIWLLISSLIFYAWGEPRYVLILLISICINYSIGLIVGKCRDNNLKKARTWVVIDVTANLLILFVFKYLAFVINTVNAFVEFDLIPVPNITLPIGISFFTFQALSYVIDIYRGETEAQKNPLYVGLYIAFFPQLIAGPIVRYRTIAEQIKMRKSSIGMFTNGTTRFAIGFSKKILLANNLAVLADSVFNLTLTGKKLYSVPASMAWLGAICYMLQIYMDFSAYSDMAIGLGQMFGFQFEENFNYPYVSMSISEFWRRWHISLGTWFKEYVYIPLGGSRTENKDTMVRNTFIVWLLTGVWHGAYWTFIIWGLYNFIFIMGERIVGFEKRPGKRFGKHIYSLLVIMFGWVIFRADTLYELSEYIGNMFGLNSNGLYNSTVGMMIKEYAIVLAFSIIFSTPIAKICREKLDGLKVGIKSIILKLFYLAATCAVFALAIISMVKGGYNPFIYFNF